MPPRNLPPPPADAPTPMDTDSPPAARNVRSRGDTPLEPSEAEQAAYVAQISKFSVITGKLQDSHAFRNLAANLVNTTSSASTKQRIRSVRCPPLCSSPPRDCA